MTQKKETQASTVQALEGQADKNENKTKTFIIPLNRPIDIKHKDGNDVNEIEVIEPYGYMMRGFGLSDILNVNEEAYAKLFPKITKNIPIDYRLIKELDIDLIADLQDGLMNMLSEVMGVDELVKERNGDLVLSLPQPIQKDGVEINELSFPRRVQSSVWRGHGMQALRSRDIDCICAAAARVCQTADLKEEDFKKMKLSNLIGLGEVIGYWLGEKVTDADFI